MGRRCLLVGFCSTPFSSAVVRELGTKTELGRGGFVRVSFVSGLNYKAYSR